MKDIPIESFLNSKKKKVDTKHKNSWQSKKLSLYKSIGYREIENILSLARLELQVCHNYLSDYIKFLHMKAKVNTPVLTLVSNATNLLNKTILYSHYSQNSNIFETYRYRKKDYKKTKRQKTLVILKMVPFISSIHKILKRDRVSTNIKSNGYPSRWIAVLAMDECGSSHEWYLTGLEAQSSKADTHQSTTHSIIINTKYYQIIKILFISKKWLIYIYLNDKSINR